MLSRWAGGQQGVVVVAEWWRVRRWLADYYWFDLSGEEPGIRGQHQLQANQRFTITSTPAPHAAVVLWIRIR